MVRKRVSPYFKASVQKAYKYRHNAARRCITMELSDAMMFALFARPCFYCGASSGLSGIDRVNNVGGYNDVNCVPCCAECNYMKCRMEVNSFIEQCRLVANHHHRTTHIGDIDSNSFIRRKGSLQVPQVPVPPVRVCESSALPAEDAPVSSESDLSELEPERPEHN